MSVPILLLALTLSGTVLETSPEADYTIWLTDTADLTAPHLPLAEATVDGAGGWSLTYDGDVDRAWVFLRQTLDDDVDGPLVFWLPQDVLGSSPEELSEPLEIRALPVDMARMQRGGERPDGWQVKPATMTAVIVLGPWPLLLWVRRRQRRLGPAAGPPRAPPVLDVHPREKPAMAVVLAVGGILRALRMGEPVELLEHAYGPGLPGIREAGGPPLRELLANLGNDPLAREDLLRMVLEPPSLIVTHPPGYHWLMSALGGLSNWSEPVLRAPALLASLATAVVLWRLLRRIDARAGVLAAAAWAICSPGIFYGGDASPYALVGLICAGSVLAALRAFEDGSKRSWVIWTGMLAVGFLCHYTTAIFGLLQGAVVLAMLVKHRREASWNAALGNLLSVVPFVGLLPALWTWPHFATFSIVGLDTRLMSESYPLDPGMGVFMREVIAVLCGVSPRYWWAALPLILLAGRGMRVLAARDGLLAALLGANLVAGVAGVFFFYVNHIAIMHGRIFWGFRWVSWLVPIALAVAAVGALDRRGRWRVAGPLLAGLWLAGALHFSLAAPDRSTRPDYAAAAEVIAAEMDDRDGIAALPMWGQRGPLLWYLMRAAEFDVRQPAPELPKRIWLNPDHEMLPFVSSAWNGHVDRLWVAVADERMFGRSKFVPDLANQGIARASEHLEPDGRWDFDHLTLHRFKRPAADAWDGSGRLVIAPPIVDIGSLRYQEPNKWYCGQVSEYPDVAPSQGTWMIHLRVPLQPGVGPVHSEVTEGELTELNDKGAFAAVVVGARCDGPAPQVALWTGSP